MAGFVAVWRGLMSRGKWSERRDSNPLHSMRKPCRHKRFRVAPKRTIYKYAHRFQSRVALKGQMERAKGFKPFTLNAQTLQAQAFPSGTQEDHIQIRAQISEPVGPQLAKVVGAWLAPTA